MVIWSVVYYFHHMPELELERVSNILPKQESAGSRSVEVRSEEEPKHESPQQSAGTVAVSLPQAHRVAAAASVHDPRSGILKSVEDILADGLQELYRALPEDRKRVFKQKGEAIANTITDLVMRGAARVKEVWGMLRDWLGALPGINTYFIEQEIKIKTDRVMLFAASVPL